MTPDEVRNVTLNDLFHPDMRVQAMALMQMFPNLVYFDTGRYGYEHSMAASGSSQATSMSWPRE